MLYLYIGLTLLLFAGIVLLIAYICFRRVFYSPPRKLLGADEYELPKGEIYLPFAAQMIDWIKAARAMSHEEMTVISHDGLKLHGTYYECCAGAPIEILFHGYQGDGERDLSGGIERCFAMRHNALIVDQRGHGRSEGNVTTFGIKERFDCLCWVEHVIARFGADTQIVLTGVSMGAATVMLAAGEKLPANVIYVLADCGYTSAREIISKVMAEMHLPPAIVYPFVRLGGRLFGHFDPDETSPMNAVEKSCVPIIFIHGDTDAFVPYDMSVRLHERCTAKKALQCIPGAGHGLAYPVDKEAYIDALLGFCRELNL
jgi:pimeloyl-ACP methyl ester carboxylesterase